MKDILTRQFVLRNLSIYGSVIVIFTYNILLDKDFACTCKSQDVECGLYIGLPVFLIFVLVVWTDKPLERLCRYWCTHYGIWNHFNLDECYCSSLCCFFFLHFVKAVCIGLLWVAFVLLDGDWYVCCESSQEQQTAHLACKDKTKLTEDERISIAELKSKSRVIGFSVLFVIVGLTFIVLKFRCRKCCGKSSRCCDGKDFYYKLILEEEEKSLEEAFRNKAKEKLTTGVITGEHWEECFEDADKLIKKLIAPRGAAGVANRGPLDGTVWIPMETWDSEAAAAASGPEEAAGPGSAEAGAAGSQNHGSSDENDWMEMENMDSEKTPLMGEVCVPSVKIKGKRRDIDSGDV